MTRIAVIGLGEAGRRYVLGLADAGAEVRGYDSSPGATDADAYRAARLADAVRSADLVISLVGGRAARGVAAEAAPLLGAGAVFADFNTAAPHLKEQIADVLRTHAVPMADVAVLAPVTRAGARTPLLASGPGADRVGEVLRPLGVPVDTIDAPVGSAARLKLVRSVFMKGLATLLIETLTAADTAEAGEWMRAQLVAELGPDAPALVDRLLTGTYAHTARREQEVRDALELLDSLDAPSDMTRATLAWFERLAREAD